MVDYQPGDRLMEHKYTSFCRTSKRCEKKWGSTHQQRRIATVCVDVVFHRNFSSAGWTDQHVLPATQTDKPDLAADCLHYVAGHDFRCLSSADGTWIERHYMTTVET
jgi:hypothetical protein